MMLENASRKLGRFINWSSLASPVDLVKQHHPHPHQRQPFFTTNTAFVQVNQDDRMSCPQCPGMIWISGINGAADMCDLTTV